ncbi:MAG TPA: SDR family NAD(P)-dependent oxidoreductase, partial [Mycobacterium sp.]
MSSVNGKVVLITGGANGVGAELARGLHAKGAKLVLTDLDEIPLKDVASRLDEDRVLSVVADVRDLSAMQAAVAAGTDRFGGIDVVVANAGIAVYGSVLNADPAAFKTILDVNALGVFHTVKAALPSVIERRASSTSPTRCG